MASLYRSAPENCGPVIVIEQNCPEWNDDIADVIDWTYGGNKRIRRKNRYRFCCFCPVKGTVLDPFSGSGSSLLAGC